MAGENRRREDEDRDNAAREGDECEGMGGEDKSEEQHHKGECDHQGHSTKTKGQCSELAERIYPRKPVEFTVVQHHLIRVLKF